MFSSIKNKGNTSDNNSLDKAGHKMTANLWTVEKHTLTFFLKVGESEDSCTKHYGNKRRIMLPVVYTCNPSTPEGSDRKIKG